MHHPKSPLLISFLALRRSVGVLGIALPFLLVIGSIVIGGNSEIQPSISSYYHTISRNIFVGILCAVALFLFSYKGYDRIDQVAGILGCFFALGVAFFPCHAKPPTSGINPIIGTIHHISATLLFLDFAFYSIFLFTRSNERKENWSKVKRHRNRIYYTCGVTMLTCLILIVVSFSILKNVEFIQNNNPVFWLETIALIAFGVSWLTKGQAILKD